MLALLATVQVLVESGALYVDPGLDTKLPCSANAALEQAIRVRLPKVKIRSRGKPSPGDLSATIRDSGHGFRFEVRGADGSLAMSRDLFTGCPQLGDMSALILDRYLAEVKWVGREVGLVAEPPPPPPRPRVLTTDAGSDAGDTSISDAGPSPRPSPPSGEREDAGVVDDLLSRIGVERGPTSVLVESETVAAPPRPAPTPVIQLPPERPAPLVLELSVTAGGGGWYGSGFVATFGLDVAVLIQHRIRVGAVGLATLPRTEVLAVMGDTRGQLDWLDAAGFVTLGVCTKTDLAVCGSALGGARFTWAHSFGARIPHPDAGFIVLPELGAQLRAAYVIRALIIALDLIAAAPLGAGTIGAQGFTPINTPRFDLAATLRLGVRI